MKDPLPGFVQQRRRALSLTQPDLANRAGVGLRFIRELEQGKATLRFDQVGFSLRLTAKQIENVYARFVKGLDAALQLIPCSFCSVEFQQRYAALVRERALRLELTG